MTKQEQNVQDLVFELSKSAVDYLQVLYSIDGFESAKDEFKLVKRTINKLRKQRDKQNDITKQHTFERNSLNSEVKNEIKNVKQIRELRNMENSEVKELKQKRSDLQKQIRAIKDDNEESQNKRKELLKLQEQTHKRVQHMAQDAQSSHEEMIKKNQLVDELRSKAESAHKQLRESKKIADNLHKVLVVFLERRNELADIINTSEEE